MAVPFKILFSLCPQHHKLQKAKQDILAQGVPGSQELQTWAGHGDCHLLETVGG